MRCPDCNKFVSLELQDPEVSDLQVEHLEPEDKAGEHRFNITGNVRIVRNCGECGQELKEANLEIDQEVELGENTLDAAAVELHRTLDLSDATVEEDGVDSIEEGGGRYAKSYFGATVHFTVYLDKTAIASGEWSDKVAASEMDELV